MRFVHLIRAAAAIAAAVSLVAPLGAADPCPTCATGVSPTLSPKPKCDNQIYPLSEGHYIRRYCGPVISPNATYGHYTTQWRPWDGGTTQAAGCTAPAAVMSGNPVGEMPKMPTPEPAAPGALPKVAPPAGSGKESLPAPKPVDKGKGRLRQTGALFPASPVSPGVYLVPVGK